MVEHHTLYNTKSCFPTLKELFLVSLNQINGSFKGCSTLYIRDFANVSETTKILFAADAVHTTLMAWSLACNARKLHYINIQSSTIVSNFWFSLSDLLRDNCNNVKTGQLVLFWLKTTTMRLLHHDLYVYIVWVHAINHKLATNMLTKWLVIGRTAWVKPTVFSNYFNPKHHSSQYDFLLGNACFCLPTDKASESKFHWSGKFLRTWRSASGQLRTGSTWTGVVVTFEATEAARSKLWTSHLEYRY